MAIKKAGQRGRPIDFNKRFKEYTAKVDWLSKTYGTNTGRKIMAQPVFEEQYYIVREKYGFDSRTALRFLAQQAGLGASLNQLNAYMRGASKLGIVVTLKDATKAFSVKVIGDFSDIDNKVSNALGEDWSLDVLAAAVASGEISLSEANMALRIKFGMADSEQRAEWISQNIFGSD